jgi:c-di-GMP-binding flagellar brake protein YcgR
LDESARQSVLAEAVSRRLPVQLYPHGLSDTVLRRGSIRQADEQGLLIEPIDRLAEFPLLSSGTRVQATICVRDRAYMIHSIISESRSGDQPGSIRLAHPERIESIERRRTPRRSLHPSTPVEVHLPTADGELRATADILNVSEKGMACRVNQRLAIRFNEGQFVWLHFQLGQSDPFDLDGRVVSLTPGKGPRAQTLVGIEFIDGQKLDECTKRLRQALSVAEPAGPWGATHR